MGDYRCHLSEISLLYCENFGEFGKCLIFVGFVRWESEKWVNLNCQKIYFCLDFQYFIEVTIEVNLRWFGELCENLMQFWSWRGSWTHPHPGAKVPMKYNVNYAPPIETYHNSIVLWHQFEGNLDFVHFCKLDQQAG